MTDPYLILDEEELAEFDPYVDVLDDEPYDDLYDDLDDDWEDDEDAPFPVGDAELYCAVTGRRVKTGDMVLVCGVVGVVSGTPETDGWGGVNVPLDHQMVVETTDLLTSHFTGAVYMDEGDPVTVLRSVSVHGSACARVGDVIITEDGAVAVVTSVKRDMVSGALIGSGEKVVFHQGDFLVVGGVG